VKKQKTKGIKAYLCNGDFYYELPNEAEDIILSPSIEALKRRKKCWKSCGILQVEITVTKVIKKGTDKI